MTGGPGEGGLRPHHVKPGRQAVGPQRVGRPDRQAAEVGRRPAAPWVEDVAEALAVHDNPPLAVAGGREDRKSTRLNSSHSQISYAVFCLKKKKQEERRSVTLRTAA